MNAIANQLRYPNIHTWYFMEVILYLFAESGQTAQGLHAKEQIARYVQIIECIEISNKFRVILERVFSRGPHPWGLKVTVVQLFKRDDFWNSDFVNCDEKVRKESYYYFFMVFTIMYLDKPTV